MPLGSPWRSSVTTRRRRSRRLLKKYIVFVSLLSVVILLLQQRPFLGHVGSGETKRVQDSQLNTRESVPVAAKSVQSVPSVLSVPPVPEDLGISLTNVTKDVTPQVNMPQGEEISPPPANFSMSNFYHSDPCNSTLARMVTENITFYDNETLCNPQGLPVMLTPDLYKMPELSKLFVHCENWKDALSSSVAQGELTGACLSGHSILPKNAQQVIKPIHNLAKRFHKRPLSCAVVGSSSQIFANPDYGRQIDKHHVVIRLNQAPTNGSCAQYTGTKTTIRILNGRWTYKYIHIDRASFLPLEKDSLLIISRTTGKDYQRLHQKLNSTRPDVDVRMLSREVIGVSKALLKAYKSQVKDQLKVGFKGGDTPSSGLVALVIALNICSKVSLYGFGVVRRNFSRARYARKFYHYFSHMMGQQSEDEVHSFDAEIALMASLGQYRSTINFCGISRELNYTTEE